MPGRISSIPSHDKLLSLREATDRGYAGYSTLRKYIADGRLPAVTIGSRVKVLRTDLDALAVPRGAATPESVERAIDRIVATAPPLTQDQVRRLASRLGGAL